MDLRCINCGEPWNMDHVLHDEPESFERKGGVIEHCPVCESHEKNGTMPDKKEQGKLEAIAALGDVLGDDVDGLASELEDFGLL